MSIQKCFCGASYVDRHAAVTSATGSEFGPVAGPSFKAGLVGINSFAMAASEAPFGGTNHSGMGREGGVEGIRDYLDVKSSQVVWA